MNRRAALIGLAFAVLTAVLLVVYLRRYEEETSGGPRVPILVLTKPVERGKPITDDALGIRTVPRAYVEQRAVKVSEKAKILGIRTVVALSAQQQLMWTDLAVVGHEHQILTDKVTNGKRAMSLRLSADDTSVGLIQPGDFIDVYAVLGTNRDREAKRSVLLLQQVLVLAAGFDTEADPRQDGSRTPRVPVLTVLLSPPQAQLLALAAERARLIVALRNSEDPTVVERPIDVTSTVFDGEPPPPPKAAPPPAHIRLQTPPGGGT
jgi:pilus assembly protein CpaB